MGFGTHLQNLLHDRNMTVSELSRITGISTNTLYAIIRRDSGNVNLENLRKIAAALNISLGELTVMSDKQINVIDALDDFIASRATRENFLLEKFRAVDEKGKHTIETIADMEYNRCKKDNSAT